MKKTKIIMGMPITVEVITGATLANIESIFKYFRSVDEQFSTYKPTSEISKVNDGLPKSKWSSQMKLVFELCQETKEATHGYFNINHKGKIDPSGLVKGWAVFNAAQLLHASGATNFYIEAGGDIQVNGHNSDNSQWLVGIRNPFNIEEIIKIVRLDGQGMATSGTYIRGQHIYNPHHSDEEIKDIKSLTVIAANVYEADRFATAAFAMGNKGIGFIEQLPGLEGYVVGADGIATFTSGFESYVVSHA
jgi:thiamine biosynthesis lipoprotein